MFYSELIKAQLENTASNPTPISGGLIYYQTTNKAPIIDDGTDIRRLPMYLDSDFTDGYLYKWDETNKYFKKSVLSESSTHLVTTKTLLQPIYLKTLDSTPGENTSILLFDCTAGNCLCYLPPTPVNGYIITIKKIDFTANTVTITIFGTGGSGSGATNIENGDSIILENGLEFVTLVAYNNNYYRIA